MTGADAVRIAPDPDQVPALAAEREAQWRRVSEAEFLSDAEKRQLLGLPPRPEPRPGADADSDEVEENSA